MNTPNIVKGQRVWIKTPYQDDGDNNLTWFATEDSTDARGEMPRINIANVEAAEQFAIVPTTRVCVQMISTTNPNS